jgi:hypothetical protein
MSYMSEIRLLNLDEIKFVSGGNIDDSNKPKVLPQDPQQQVIPNIVVTHTPPSIPASIPLPSLNGSVGDWLILGGGVVGTATASGTPAVVAAAAATVGQASNMTTIVNVPAIKYPSVTPGVYAYQVSLD